MSEMDKVVTIFDWDVIFQLSSGSKKDLNARDFLSKSIISAVTRKRKKHPSAHFSGRSADEDSEHEPIKASNYGGGEGGGEEEDRGEEEAVKKEHTIPKKEKINERGIGVKVQETTEGKEAEKDVSNGPGNDAKNPERESRSRAAPQLPNSFLYSHHQTHQITCPRPPTMTSPPPHPKPHNLSRGHPKVPFWISPTRLPNLYQPSRLHGAQQLDWNQPVLVRYRKTSGGRMRAMSMNLDLELGRSEDKVRGWRAERVEVIRVIEGTPGQHGSVGVPQGSVAGPGLVQQIDPPPHLAQEAPPLSSSSSGWIDQSSPGSSTVVLRRSAPDTRDKTKGWRRHTVVV